MLLGKDKRNYRLRDDFVGKRTIYPTVNNLS